MGSLYDVNCRLAAWFHVLSRGYLSLAPCSFGERGGYASYCSAFLLSIHNELIVARLDSTGTGVTDINTRREFKKTHPKKVKKLSTPYSLLTLR